MGKIVIDPVTRIEGHLKIECVVDGGVVKDARATGNLFRGLELILRGRDPRRTPRRKKGNRGEGAQQPWLSGWGRWR